MKIYSKHELNYYSLSLTYDDISLIPTEISRVKTRSDVNIKSNFLGKELSVPVVSSPMDTVTGIAMAKELSSSGCIGIVNRFDSSLSELFSNGSVVEGIQAVSVSLTAEDELLEKKETTSLRLKHFSQQEEKVRKNAEELQAAVVSELKQKK